MAGLYIFDNTLLGGAVTGAQIRDYLEFSADYFKQVDGTGPFAPDDVTNAVDRRPHRTARPTTTTTSWPAWTRR